MPLQYVKGDATDPQGTGNRIVLHCCNDIGGWGSGFVLALSRRWPLAEKAYRAWYRADLGNFLNEGIVVLGPLLLGEVQFVCVHPEIWVANLIGQHGVRSYTNPRPIDYDSFRYGFQKVEAFAKAKAASVHMPRMGAGLAGGDWDTIEKIITAELVNKGVSVTVYDLP